MQQVARWQLVKIRFYLDQNQQVHGKQLTQKLYEK